MARCRLLRRRHRHTQRDRPERRAGHDAGDAIPLRALRQEVNPSTGDVVDPEGEVVGNLGDY